MQDLPEEEQIWLRLACGGVEPDFLGCVFSFLEPDLHFKGSFNTLTYIDLTVQFITFENIFINTTLILLHISYDTTLYVFQTTQSFIQNRSAYNVDSIGPLIPKIVLRNLILLANESTNVLEESVSRCCQGAFCARPQGTSDRCFFTNCQQYFMAGLFLIPLFTQFITHYWPRFFLRT